jgi:N6-adenosine-specific RNA methylase IME4
LSGSQAHQAAERAEQAAERKERKEEKKRSLVAAGTFSETGPFGTIVIDPPWEMEKIDRAVRPNQDVFDYPTMSIEQLLEFWIKDLGPRLESDCHTFMWTTEKWLPEAIRFVGLVGFKYVLTMVWHKPGGFQPVGLPQYNCEFVVYARRGAAVFVDTKNFNCCFDGERREHSRKPDNFYDVIRRVTGGSRIDVFSREKREGFATFGNESNKFTEAAE